MPALPEPNSACKCRDAARPAGYTRCVNGSPPTPTPSASAPADDAAASAPASVSQLSTSPSQLAPTVPDHTLLRCIGVGSYGEVWLARSALGTLRAVKLVRRAAFDDDRPFEREFAGLQKFEPLSRTHEGFVDLLQVGRNDAEGWFYYVMELADTAEPRGSDQCSVNSNQSPTPAAPATPGSPLNTDLLSTDYSPQTLRGPRSLDECLRIARTLAGALAELHRHGLVHRDIKPSNIIFVDGVPKLADVGLVATAKGVGQDRSFVGTEGFIPPEGPGTPQADLYSLGIVLYVLSTGKSHRDFPEPPADLATRPDPERQRWLEFSAIIHRACQASPRDRYPTAAALLADLEHLDAGKSVKRRHSLQRGWTWTWKMAAALALVALAFVLIRNERDRRAALTRLNASPFEKSGTTNVVAWEAVERASQMVSTFTAIGYSNAIQELERALVLDPNYSGAWVTLASSLNSAAYLGFIPSKPAMERVRLCCETAVILKPSNAAAHFFLGEAEAALSYDFAKAESIMRSAIALDPKFTALRNNFALYLTHYGRFDEAESLLDQVRRDDPKWGGSHSLRAKIHAAKRQFEPALNEIEKALRLLPDRPSFHLVHSEILWAMGRPDESARARLRYVEMNGYIALDRALDFPVLAQTLNTRGPAAFFTELIHRLEQARAAGRFVSQYDLATLHAQAGHKPQALDWLEQAVDEHRSLTLGAKYSVVFKDFQDEPRYHALLRQLKLEK